jgi:hypothetical protein
LETELPAAVHRRQLANVVCGLRLDPLNILRKFTSNACFPDVGWSSRLDNSRKCQAIREILDQDPKASEVVALLAKKQIHVKPGPVYMIKGRLVQMKSEKKRKAARVARAGQKTGSTNPVALIVKVKALAKEAGGMEHLKTLVAVLAE